MVCKHCEKKLGKLIVPDKWKEGSRSEDRSAGKMLKRGFSDRRE